MKKCAAIILAAGMSSRMTTFKPLLEVGGMTLTDRLILIYLENNQDVIVVTGWKDKELKSSLKSQNVKIVHNPDFQYGMFSSVKTGVRALGDSYSAFFIQPVDIPLIRPYTLKSLIMAHQQQPEVIIYPTYKGKRGHPVLVPAALTPKILGGNPEGGLKEILEALPEITLEVKTADRNILFDVDTPQDFQELLRRFSKYETPNLEECEVILNDVCGVPGEIRKHGLKVAEVAVTIAQALIKRGINLDLETLQAGALLHDLAKGQKQHDKAGGKMLRELGFGRVADIVAVHTDLPREATDWESKIVFLADKLVKGTMLVTLAQRYELTGRPFEVTPDIVSVISTRRKRAEEIKKEFESLLGEPLEQLLL